MEVNAPQEFFEKVLPGKFKLEKAVGLDVIAQLDIDGPNGGSWVITIREQKIKVEKGVCPKPMLWAKIEEKAYMDIVNGKLSGEEAFITGKFALKGDLGLALKLKKLGFL